MGNSHIIFPGIPNTALLSLEAHCPDNVPDTSYGNAQADSAGAALHYDIDRAHGTPSLPPDLLKQCPRTLCAAMMSTYSCRQQALFMAQLYKMITILHCVQLGGV